LQNLTSHPIALMVGRFRARVWAARLKAVPFPISESDQVVFEE